MDYCPQPLPISVSSGYIIDLREVNGEGVGVGQRDSAAQREMGRAVGATGRSPG